MRFQVWRAVPLWSIVLLVLFGMACSTPLERGPENVHYTTLDGHRVRVTWDPVPGAEFYRIRYNSEVEIQEPGNIFQQFSSALDGTPMKHVAVKEEITGTTWEGLVGKLLSPTYWVRACDRNECGRETGARQVAMVTKGPCINGMVLTPGDACLVDTEGDKEFLVDHYNACLRVTTENWEPPGRFPTSCGGGGLALSPEFAARQVGTNWIIVEHEPGGE